MICLTTLVIKFEFDMIVNNDTITRIKNYIEHQDPSSIFAFPMATS